MWRQIVVYFFALTSFANAATNDVMPRIVNKSASVTISGILDSGDGDRFHEKIVSLSSEIVYFTSDGGSLIAGLQIGETIRSKNFSTFVPNNALCASACALAWPGGTQRFMGPGAQIGFHAAFNSKTGQETGVGNALVGAYLNKIGLPYKAVIYITSASPESMAWLNLSDAKKLGIEVTPFQSPIKLQAPAKDTSVRQVLEDFGFLGNWSPRCDQSAGPGNSLRHVFVTSAGDVRFTESLGADYKENVYVVLTAKRQAGDRVLLLIELNGTITQRLTMMKQEGRIRTITNRGSDGHVVVRDGLVLTNRQPTPWLSRCDVKG